MSVSSGVLLAAFPFSAKYKGMDSDRYSPTFNTEWSRTDFSSLYWEIKHLDGSPVDQNMRIVIYEDISKNSDKKIKQWDVWPRDQSGNNLVSNDSDIRPNTFTSLVRKRKMYVAEAYGDGKTSIEDERFKTNEYVVYVYGVTYFGAEWDSNLSAQENVDKQYRERVNALKTDVYQKMQVSNLTRTGAGKLIVATSAAPSGGKNDRASGNFSTKMISTDEYSQIYWRVVYHNGSQPTEDMYFGIYSDKSARNDSNPFGILIKSEMMTQIIRDRNFYVRAPQATEDFTLYLFAK